MDLSTTFWLTSLCCIQFVVDSIASDLTALCDNLVAISWVT